MIKNKKILTLFLVVMFVFALGTTAFAGYGTDYSFNNIPAGERTVIHTLSGSEIQRGNVFIGAVDVRGDALRYSIELNKISSDYFTTSSGMHYFGQPFNGSGPYQIVIKNKSNSPISGRVVYTVD